MVDIKIAILALGPTLDALSKTLPSLLEAHCVQPVETFSFSNPNMIETVSTYHGTIMRLYGLIANDDANARHRVLEAARAITTVCRDIRGTSKLRKVQAFLVAMVRFLVHVFRNVY